MKKHFFLILLLLSLQQNAYTQGNKIWILDSLTQKPISNVLVQFNNKNFYSNSLGNVIINRLDTLKLSHEGYITKLIFQIPKKDTLFLVKKPHLFDEVEIITPKKHDFYKVGYYKEGEFLFKNWTIINNYCISAVYIPNTAKNIFISKVLLKIKTKRGAKNYNVYLYKPDSLGLPGKVVFKKNIVVDSLQKEGVIDIKSLNINMPKNGIFIGLENLKKYDFGEHPIIKKGVNIEYTNKYDNSKVYIFLQNSAINPKRKWMNYNKALSSHQTFCFGLEVYHK